MKYWEQKIMAVAAISINYAVHCVHLYKAEDNINVKFYIIMIYL